MKRRLVIAALALIRVTLAAVADGAIHKVYVERDIVDQELAYRPHAIGPSADGTFAIIGIGYQSYGGSVATATGQAYVRGCTSTARRARNTGHRRRCTSRTRSGVVG